MKKLVAAVVLSLSFASAAHADEVADVYMAKCKGCHGADGRAQTKVGIKEKVADMTNADWQSRHSDEEIRQVIAEGSPKNKKMKAFKDRLTAEQIDALVKYIRQMKK